MSIKLKKLLAFLLSAVMLLGVMPAMAAYGGDSTEEVHTYTEEENAQIEEDVFAKIEKVKTMAATRKGGIEKMTEADYVAMVPEVINAVENSETYVPGSLQRNGNFLVWMTKSGIPCCFDPRMEAELHNTENDPTPEEIAKAEAEAEAMLDKFNELRGGTPSSANIGLIQPYWESTSNYSDSDFNGYSPSYKAMWQNLYNATGGTGIRYTMTNANINNIASTMEQCGLVIFDSHGTTDYSNGDDDYTSRANSSYLCLTTNTGITSADTAAQTGTYGTYYNCMKGSGYAYVNGTCIANHMTKNAPNSLLYMGICLGMATDGMHKGLREKGVEVVYGYSQSVSFVGEEKYMKSILGYVKDGETFGDALSISKDALGKWDPAYSSYTQAQAVSNRVAFPITVSSEDVYPGHGNVDTVQDVYSTWMLSAPTALESYSLDKSSVEMYEYDTAEITFNRNPVNANEYALNWSVDDTSIAKISGGKSGATVTGVKGGETVARCQVVIGGEVVDTLTVNVKINALPTLNELLNVANGKLNFTSTGNYPWHATKVGNDWLAASGNKGVDSSESIMELTLGMKENEKLIFKYKVSSENNYDYLYFTVNGTQKFKKAGNINWTTYTFTADHDGTYTFKWRYYKDDYKASGDDMAYIKEVEYQSLGLMGDVNQNGVLDPDDALMVMRYTMHVEELSSYQVQLADINGDGKVTMNDALMILRKVQGLIS